MSETQRLHIAAAAAHYHFVVPRRPQDASSAARSCLRRRLCSLRMTEAEPCEHACMPDACMQHQSQGCATRHTHAQNKLQRWNKRGVERRSHTYLGNTASFYRLLSVRLSCSSILRQSLTFLTIALSTCLMTNPTPRTASVDSCSFRFTWRARTHTYTHQTQVSKLEI